MWRFPLRGSRVSVGIGLQTLDRKPLTKSIVAVYKILQTPKLHRHIPYTPFCSAAAAQVNREPQRSSSSNSSTRASSRYWQDVSTSTGTDINSSGAQGNRRRTSKFSSGRDPDSSSSSSSSRGNPRLSLFYKDVISLSSSQEVLSFANRIIASYALNRHDLLLLLQQLAVLQHVRSSSSSFNAFWIRAAAALQAHKTDAHLLRLSFLYLADAKCANAVVDLLPLLHPHVATFTVLELSDIFWRFSVLSLSLQRAAAAAGQSKLKIKFDDAPKLFQLVVDKACEVLGRVEASEGLGFRVFSPSQTGCVDDLSFEEIQILLQVFEAIGMADPAFTATLQTELQRIATLTGGHSNTAAPRRKKFKTKEKRVSMTDPLPSYSPNRKP
ncbi:hypothetical protein, conserved [Eimeria necatrix]|uniref:Uncharacterized protein n=1 Tax=Eimeria necatrix TaxID=51315 RepID=U6MS49_9EIME|nr:hypothetical protein, conserved [Eimeria necatrix]CDJ66841.1 hypothetical protein, conserved [Eimeria necatrix]